MGLALSCLKTACFSLCSLDGQELFPTYTKGSHAFRLPLSDKLLFLWLLLAVMVAFSIVSLNVDGIRDDDKRARIFEYLKFMKHDFFLLQETHVQTEDVEAWSAEWGRGMLLESWWQ